MTLPLLLRRGQYAQQREGGVRGLSACKGAAKAACLWSRKPLQVDIRSSEGERIRLREEQKSALQKRVCQRVVKAPGICLQIEAQVRIQA